MRTLQLPRTQTSDLAVEELQRRQQQRTRARPVAAPTPRKTVMMAQTTLHLLESCRTGLLNESLGNENCNTSKISKLG